MRDARKNALQEKLVTAVKLFVSRAGVGVAETEAVVEALEAGEKLSPGGSHRQRSATLAGGVY